MSGLPSSFDDNADFYEENRWQKLFRKLKEEPLVPFGCAVTCYALYQATKSMRRGDHARTNRMFRARIYAQGFTLLAIVAGSAYYKEEREKRHEYDTAVAQQKAKEKSEAWIKELEARDLEEKEYQERRKAARQAAEEARGAGAARSALEKSERREEVGVLQAVRDLVNGRV
ncbi:hypothetical protein L228DRAFT_235336 [Xylona heveae TC161]|uniref:HIG1 domain-containing protein n=1 Tax=Xylona heveae (strain CBS 132557 / TC161) TaxID=1328760 RepID=A0A165JH96_XYLHT|nr:hypothetical protein L228DRAFT_235336 [Xylona heveae TC161]KZF26238.1 hypothetical protein L228DRAFT_235336 [Xylona heveae TC161]